MATIQYGETHQQQDEVASSLLDRSVYLCHLSRYTDILCTDLQRLCSRISLSGDVSLVEDNPEKMTHVAKSCICTKT